MPSATITARATTTTTQPGNLFRLMTPDQQARLMDNLAEAMQGVPIEIVKRQLADFYRADPAYGRGVGERLGITCDDMLTLTAAA